ncbi:MAG TPA: MFS transporter, partial [Candidatus Aciduliprofundum boonei]|nr:MFS transporter [Candidatus Aciduliprofundum boonei]
DIALPLYVLDQTKSGTMMSVFVMAELVPRLILSPIAGVVGDRYNRKALMVWLDIARGILLFSIIWLNLLDLKSLLIVQILMSIMGTFFSAGISAMYPDLVEKEELAKANSIIQSAGIVTRIAGPIMGGVLYAFGGIKLAILINAISFFGSGLFEMLIHYEWKSRKIGNIGEVWEDLKEGLSFLKARKSISLLLIYALILNFLLNPIGTVVLPYLYRVQFGFSSTQFGSLETAFMVGMLLGNMLIMGKLGPRAENLVFKFLFVELILEGIMTVLASPCVSMNTWQLYLFFVAIQIPSGATNALVNVPIMTKLQKMVPSELRGRIFSVIELLAMGTTPIGVALVGVAMRWFEAYQLMAIAILGGFLITVYYVLNYASIIIGDGEKESY